MKAPSVVIEFWAKSLSANQVAPVFLHKCLIIKYVYVWVTPSLPLQQSHGLDRLCERHAVHVLPCTVAIKSVRSTPFPPKLSFVRTATLLLSVPPPSRRLHGGSDWWSRRWPQSCANKWFTQRWQEWAESEGLLDRLSAFREKGICAVWFWADIYVYVYIYMWQNVHYFTLK